MISPETAKAFDQLLKANFAGSITACVERAIIDANESRKPRG
ncbi:DNA-binding protein [Xanthomonas phage Kintu]